MSNKHFLLRKANMANQFKIGDKVQTVVGNTISVSRLNGRVKYIACQRATKAGGSTCDKKTCAHPIKEMVWVLWPAFSATFSYHYSELAYDASQFPLPSLSLPSAEKMLTTKSSGNKIKDSYIEKAKNAINNILDPKPVDVEFWKTYKGYSRIKYDVRGRPYSFEEDNEQKPQLSVDEINWDAYKGIAKGPIRKLII